MKEIAILGIMLLLTQNFITAAVGMLTNNAAVPINVVMYSNYVAPTAKISAKGRLNGQGLIIPGGNNITFLPGTTSIDVYYGDEHTAGIHADINTNFSYTISPAPTQWIITQDQN